MISLTLKQLVSYREALPVLLRCPEFDNWFWSLVRVSLAPEQCNVVAGLFRFRNLAASSFMLSLELKIDEPTVIRVLDELIDARLIFTCTFYHSDSVCIYYYLPLWVKLIDERGVWR